jgi:hypothetical protein
MKKLIYLLLFGLLACAGTDPEPVKQPIEERVTCFFDTWYIVHNAPGGAIPYGTHITYNITPNLITASHAALQYTMKVKNLGPDPISVFGTITNPNQVLNANQYTTKTLFASDCTSGATNDFLRVSKIGNGTQGANVVVTLTAVNASHLLGSPVSNSMVFQ